MYFGGSWNGLGMSVFFIDHLEYFTAIWMVYFMAVWHSLCSFGIVFPFRYVRTKKNRGNPGNRQWLRWALMRSVRCGLWFPSSDLRGKQEQALPLWLREAWKLCRMCPFDVLCNTHNRDDIFCCPIAVNNFGFFVVVLVVGLWIPSSASIFIELNQRAVVEVNISFFQTRGQRRGGLFKFVASSMLQRKELQWVSAFSGLFFCCCCRCQNFIELAPTSVAMRRGRCGTLCQSGAKHHENGACLKWHQGCQMVFMGIKIPNLGIFWKDLERKIWIYSIFLY
jgi:hypothetical protein